MLSDEDKARIEAEEAYRIETRHRLEARAARPAPSPLEPPRQHSYEFEAAQQIARERAAAAGEKRDPSDTSSESTGTSPLKIFMIAVLALIAAPFLDSSHLEFRSRLGSNRLGSLLHEPYDQQILVLFAHALILPTGQARPAAARE